MLTTDEFINKFYKELLTDEDLEDINYLTNFTDTVNTYWEAVEEAEDYIIWLIINTQHSSKKITIPIKKLANKSRPVFLFYILYMSLEYYIIFLLYFNIK